MSNAKSWKRFIKPVAKLVVAAGVGVAVGMVVSEVSKNGLPKVDMPDNPKDTK